MSTGSNSFLKPRSLPAGARGGRSFAQQAKRAQAAAQRGGGFKQIDGQYNTFWPREEKALWIAFCPDQSWSFEIYDSEEGQVATLSDQLFYAYISHYVASTNRKFNCSAGAHRDKPCWGCAIRRDFYAKKTLKEKEMGGVKLQGEAPLNAILQYAIAGTELEMQAKIEATDKQSGKVRKNKKGEVIIKEVPTALLPLAEAKRLRAEGLTSFGRRMHYSMGKTHFKQITDYDEELANYCASCAQLLTVTEMACGECGTPQAYTDEESNIVELKGQALTEARAMALTCECGYHGPMVPIVNCECGNPVEGKLLDFAIKLIKHKTGEKQTELEITEVKPLAAFLEKYPEVAEMMAKPIALNEVFAPSSLGQQEYCIPEKLRLGLSPAPRPKKGEEEELAEPYAFGESIDADEGQEEVA